MGPTSILSLGQFKCTVKEEEETGRSLITYSARIRDQWHLTTEDETAQA